MLCPVSRCQVGRLARLGMKVIMMQQNLNLVEARQKLAQGRLYLCSTNIRASLELLLVS